MRDHQKERVLKCVVWDLDNTLWNGVLLEGDSIVLREEVLELIHRLDALGVLHSVASRNEPESTLAVLEEHGLGDMFLYPQIGWGTKSTAIAKIAEALNISLDAIVFVDDQLYEREEVNFFHPEVRCLADTDLEELRAMAPQRAPVEAAERRIKYLADIERLEAEVSSELPKEEFLATLQMRFAIRLAAEGDLARAEELTVRTNQLNTTGVTYSYEMLDALRTSDSSMLLMATLEDRFGNYGTIGLALVECDPSHWTIRLLLMSCRVAARGVGNILLATVMEQAARAGVKLRADFVPTPRNRMMYVTYRFAGFRKRSRDGDRVLLEATLEQIPKIPPYVHVELGDGLT